MINAAYHDKLFIYIGLYISVYQGCFWHYIRHDYYEEALDFYRGFVSGEAHLPSSDRGLSQIDC